MSVSEGRDDLASSDFTTGLLNSSGVAGGAINPAGDSDWFRIWLSAGVRYSATLADLGVDGLLYLRDGFGDELAAVDANGPGNTSTLSYTPTTSGSYFLDVQSVRLGSGALGLYLLGLESNAPDDYPAFTNTSSLLTLGLPRSGSIEIGNDADWHKFTMVAGRSYMVSVSGALANPALKLLDDDGQDLGISGGASMTFAAAADSVRYIEISSSTPSTVAPYSLLVREVPTLRVSDVTVAEGNGPTTAVTFTLSLTTTSPLPVTVQVATADITAVAGVDYVATQRTVTIPAGSLSVPFTVNAIGNGDFQPNRAFELQLSNATNAGVAGNGVGVLLDDDKPAALPLPADPLLGYQWYLYTVRAMYAWELATGKGIRVGVFDQGIDPAQPDLKANAGLAQGVNAASLVQGGAPVNADDQHGTWVAGVIAAAGDGQGLVGTAYGASVVPIYSPLIIGPQYLREVANAFAFAQSLDVLNNSWGFGNQLLSDTDWAFYDNANDPAFAPAFAALKSLADRGRQGLGTVVVQSAGNAYSFGDDTNLHNFQNSRYIITVGATDYYNRSSVFSTSGASILVSAPGGDGGEGYASILTTDRVGAAGGSSGDTAYVDGTSFAAPIVSGVVAMMLEANPRLGYRDVQQILAYTAQQIDVGIGEWDNNGAGNWNGGGLHYNLVVHATGFGQVDALAAVRLAAGWTGTPQTSANVVEVSVTQAVNAQIPDNSDVGLTSDIRITQAMVVERADVAVQIQHPFVGDLSIVLVSPAQTFSVLLYRPAQGELSAFGSSQKDINFTFDTVLSWGESSLGDWSLRVFDDAGEDVGSLLSWTLTLIGHAESADDVYVYTNEYPDLVTVDAARSVLHDTDGGRNTLNAAALGLDNVIDLSGRSDTVLNGAKLSFAPGTVIQDAVGGDGKDRLVALDSGSELRGMRGDDTLQGGASNDRLDGGLGIDIAVETASRAVSTLRKTAEGWQFGSTLGGSDTLIGIERLKFADQSLALDLDGHAGTVARILGAVFGKDQVQNKDYAGIGLHYIDSGMAYLDLMQLAIDARLGAGASHGAVVDLLYTNVVGSPPPAADRATYVGLLDNRSFTVAGLGVFAADTDFNAAHIELAGLVQTGLGYVPFFG